MSNFRDFTEQERGKGFSYIRRSRYHPRKRVQTNDFEIRFRWRPALLEKHTQRVYSLQEMVEMIAASPFELLGAFSGFTFGEATQQSERIHFVLR
jgi:hypothetical protein